MTSATELLKTYSQEKDRIIRQSKESFNEVDGAFVQGSVARAQGPFNDIDIVVVDEDPHHAHLPSSIHSLPVQYESFTSEQLDPHLELTGRGWLSALDAVVLRGDNVERTIDERRQRMVEERAQLIHYLLAEDATETSSPDVLSNTSFFAMKRRKGSKRSILRTLVIADALSDNHLSPQPKSRMEVLLDNQKITEDVILSIFAIQSLLRQFRTPASISSEWDYHLRTTKSWVAKIQEEGLDTATFDACHPLANVTTLLVLAQNPSSTTDELWSAWERCEKSPHKDSLTVARRLVQHENFPLDSLSDSQLRSHPDITYLLQKD